MASATGNFIKGLTGCALGFLGGLMVITLLIPEQVSAGTGEVLQEVAGPQEGEAFLRVTL